MDFVVLKDEFVTDPVGVGYAAAWASGDDKTLVDLINEPRDTIQIDVQFREGWQLQNCVDPSEFDIVKDSKLWCWQLLVGLSKIEINHPQIRAQISWIWSARPVTRAALDAIKYRFGSRAEQLFGDFGEVTLMDVQKARSV